MADSFAMSREEREAFLADVRVGIIAIEQPDRGPVTVPGWYGYEPGGTVDVLMQADSRKFIGIEAAGRFSLCVQTESSPYRYVSVEGPVTSTRPYEIETDLLEMAIRYLGEQGGREYATNVGAGGNGVRVSMTPKRWSTIDYGKR